MVVVCLLQEYHIQMRKHRNLGFTKGKGRAVNFWELLGVRNQNNEYCAAVKLCSSDFKKK